MMKLLTLLFICFSYELFAIDEIDYEEAILHGKSLANKKIVIEAVKEFNRSKADSSLTNETWKKLPVHSKMVKDLTQNKMMIEIRQDLKRYVSELFISAKDGRKVGFLTKPSNYYHSGKTKHDLPMKGEIYKGKIEKDDSTGVIQFQLGIPVLDMEKPIGSLVIGISTIKYEKFLKAR